MVDVKATPKFLRLAKKAMTTEALQNLVDELALTPEKGVLIKGTGGLRKIRWQSGKSNHGKRGGIRVIYYFDGRKVVLLVTLYKKSEKENIDAGEKEQLRKLIKDIFGEPE